MKLIFEKSIPETRGFQPPTPDVPVQASLPKAYLRQQDPPLPEVGELEVVRHFTQLSRRNYCVDTNFYPLGSCTMKYNPKFTEKLAAMPGFADLHPLLPQLKEGEQFVQGALEVLFELEQLLAEITGMDYVTMQPLAGAHGELTGAMMMAAYHKAKGNKKTHIIIPDSAHGTNPASAAIAGYDIVSIPSTEDGGIDPQELARHLNEQTAGLMLTCPNTLGIFNSNVDEIARMVHEVDGLMYYDGANLNAVLGRTRPGDLGFDIVHVNVHKTFATPHGGGGPGAGPVGVRKILGDFLPISRVVRREDGTFALNYDYPRSIGYVASFYGNFSVLLKAYAYVLLLGRDGLLETSAHAVLNANYLRVRLREKFALWCDRMCMHEVVFSAARQTAKGVHAIDLAKFLIDQGIHPMTVYFPLTVKEALMIEPTETESRQALDEFIQAMMTAAELADRDPHAFHDLPKTMSIGRPDEVKAAKELNVNYFDR